MGFTSEAIGKNPRLIPADVNRAWEIWDEPPASLPNTIVAFRLIFPTPELAVRPEQRQVRMWKNVLFIEAAPYGKVVVATLFVTANDSSLRHESEPSICLASLDVGNGRNAQLVAHTEPEGDLPALVESSVASARERARAAGVRIPPDAYGYFFGHQEDGCRFIVGARVGWPA
jgi:hypothetical protein